MTKKELEQIYGLKKELMMWQRIRDNYEADIAPPIKNIDGMPYSQTFNITNPTEEKALKLAEATKIIDGKIAEIKHAIMQIELFIAQIKDDSDIRRIINYRCVQALSWHDVSKLMGEGYTEDAVRKAYCRFLIKNNIK
ncbi:MAG: hypothetical protein MJZ37_07870 [Bacilli bacterium]|nr:hypothetical protein [Bacilli bacterium]